MSILIVGGGGQLGSALQKSAPPGTRVRSVERDELDITDEFRVRELVGRIEPRVIVNAAAYNAVDRAEEEPGLAYAVNADGPRYLAGAARETGAGLVHVSTDFVFDGDASSPYEPEAEPRPLSVYGQSKRRGEQAVLESLPDRALVVRTAWLYSATGHNFVKTMLGRMRDGTALRVVADQRGTPTWAESLAAMLWKLIAAAVPPGIYHYTDAGETTWHGFAVAIQEDALSLGLIEKGVPIDAISTSEFPSAAKRPLYSVLDCSKTHAVLGTKPVEWRVMLREMLKQLET